jgi:hypothetical protein
MGMMGFESGEPGFVRWLPGENDAKVMGYRRKDRDNRTVLYVS